MDTFPTLLLSLGLLTLTPAVAQATQTVFINGVALQATPVQKGSETYYQFRASDLKRIGAITAGGVIPKIDTIRGCVGDTLFNGVYTVQLLQAGLTDGRFTVKLNVANASKQKIHNVMTFSPGDLYVASGTANAMALPHSTGRWIETLLPGTGTALHTSSDALPPEVSWTRVPLRPGSEAVKSLQQAKLPLAKVYNMEFDLTCKK